MKAPRKLLAALSVALAFALTQVSLVDDSPAAYRNMAVKPLRLVSADAYSADNTLLSQQQALVAPGGGQGFPSQWQQLRASLDGEDSWGLTSRREDDMEMPFPADLDPVLVSKVSEPAGYLAVLAGLAGMALLRRAQMKHLPWRLTC
ncbi:MAG: hypothetical protein V4631_16480 [Pseudomonadota bacterium]